MFIIKSFSNLMEGGQSESMAAAKNPYKINEIY